MTGLPVQGGRIPVRVLETFRMEPVRLADGFLALSPFRQAELCLGYCLLADIVSVVTDGHEIACGTCLPYFVPT